MKIFDVHNDAGDITGFEISNTFVGHWRACRAARDIPGARVIRWPRRWALSDDQFCEFEVEGVRFFIEEPFGDSSRFVIYANPAGPEAIVRRVRSAFASAPAVDWRLGSAG